MHSSPRLNKGVLFQLVDELAEIERAEDFSSLHMAMDSRGYFNELEGAIDLQDSAPRRSVMRSWLAGNYSRSQVPSVEVFVPVNLRNKGL